MEVNSVKVIIAGQEYTIKGEASEKTIVQIAEHVNQKIAEVADNIEIKGDKEKYRAAILAAINITGELFESRKDLLESNDKIDQMLFKAKDLSNKLDKAVAL